LNIWGTAASFGTRLLPSHRSWPIAKAYLMVYLVLCHHFRSPWDWQSQKSTALPIDNRIPGLEPRQSRNQVLILHRHN
jgi:hypothetical protein